MSTPPPAPPYAIDIEIGTLGRAMRSSHHLISFDPFDAQRVRGGREQMPFAVSTSGGNATFYLNRDVAGCSSLLPLNPAFANDSAYTAEVSGCQAARKVSLGNLRFVVRRCRRPRRTGVRTVPTIRLSDFLTGRGLFAVNFLKVDAQGLDVAIVEDVLTRTSLQLTHLQAECQELNRAPALYATAPGGAPNDCAALEALVRRHRPAGLRHVEWSLSNCVHAEWNLDFWWNRTEY